MATVSRCDSPRASWFWACLAGGCALLLAATACWLLGWRTAAGSTAIAAFAAIALGFQTRRTLRSFAFSLWVMAFVAAALTHPEAFRSWAGFELSRLMTPLIQVIMFGMGVTLCLGDFTRVLTMPKAVLVGMALQFMVMPLAGAGLALLFGFAPEVAAGVVLIGSCPGGVASNVMAYLAKGNVALSVTMTACSTLVSPLATPLLMKVLAGRYIAIEVLPMMLTIVNIILLPIVAGLLVNKALRHFDLRGAWLDRVLSVMAMIAICFIIAIITALSREELLTVGPALVAVAILHNGIGYLGGYWGARATGLDETACRTVAIEVGLQNGGMASALAVKVLNSASTALAPAIFGPWMNISGSLLASWWRRKPVRTEATPVA